MIFDKVLFGKKIKEIRENNGFSQINVCENIGISRSTLNRIEMGKVHPRKATLCLMSNFYNVDVDLVYNSCFKSEMEEYHNIMKCVELAHEKSDLEGINRYKKELSNLIIPNVSEYCVKIIEQTICLLEGAVLGMRREHKKAYPFFIEGIKKTIPDFNLNNYTDHRYEKQELQLLMNIAVTKNRIKRNPLSLEILDFCVIFFENESGLINDILGTKIYISASYEYHLNGSYYKALFHSEKGIKYNNSIRSQFGMSQLYARKGYAEYRLGLKEECLLSFKEAVRLCDIFKHSELKEAIIYDAESRLDLKLR